MDSLSNVNSLIPETNINMESLNGVKDTVEDFFLKIKNFILNLTKTNNINQYNQKEIILSFSQSILKISDSLINLGLERENRSLAYIKNEIVYILERPNLLVKYYEFITNLIDLFLDLISHLGDDNYEKYFKKFNLQLKEYRTFFRKKIHTYSEQDEKRSLMLASILWEPEE